MAVIAGVQASLGLQSAAFVAGTNQAAAAMTNLAQRTNASVNQMTQSFEKVSRTQRALRGQFQNLGFQIQDVAVQLEMGTPKLRIFTQQFGQMAQIFGSTGVVIGIVGTALGAMAGAILNAAGAAEEGAKDLDAFDSALSKNITTIDDAIEHFRALSEAERGLSAERAERQLTETNNAIDAQTQKLAELITKYAELGKVGSLAPAPQALLAGPALMPGEFLETFTNWKNALTDVASESNNTQEAMMGLIEMFTKVGDVEAATSLEDLAERLAQNQISAGKAAKELEELVNEMGTNVPASATQFINSIQTVIETLDQLDEKGKVLRAEMKLGIGGTEGARTTKEFNDTIKQSLDLFADVRKDRADAAREVTKDAANRSEGIAKLQEEAAGTKLLSAAYSENAAAVRDAEIAIAAQTKIRSLDIEAGSKQARQIVELTKSIRENEDAIKLRKTIIASAEEAKQLALVIKARGRETEELRVQQALLKVNAEQGDKAAKAAEKQFRATEAERSAAALSEEQAAIEDIIDQQRLLLRYGSDESEEYRVQLRLLQLKQSGVKEITPEMEKQVRLLEQQATGISAQEDAAKKIQELYENALEGIQDSFTDMFAELYSGGITSFEELALSIKDVFVRLAAELTTLLIFRPVILGMAGAGATGAAGGAGGAGGLAAMFGLGAAGAGGRPPIPTVGAQAGMPAGMMTGMGMPFGGSGMPINQAPWWRPGALGAQGLFMSGALGAVGGNLIGGQFGGYGGIGGAAGGGIGAVAGGLTPLGPFGSILGGLGGSLLGGALGGLFGGGGGQNNQFNLRGSALGQAGRGGTGAAAQFINQLDSQLIDVLNIRQEKLANEVLKTATTTTVNYSKEPSANDLASLTRGRIQPIAASLGLGGGVAGKPGQFTSEEMTANLQQALEILQQISNIELGPMGSELQALADAFNEAGAAARKFGIDNREALEEQYRRERQAIQRRFASERVGLEEMFGQRSSVSAAIAQMRLQFAEAAARAEELGLSAAGMAAAMATAEKEIRAQVAAQQQAIIDEARGLANLPQTFQSMFDALIARFTALRATMRETGGSLTELTALQQQATAALIKQRQAQLDAISVEAKGLVGLPPTFQQSFDALMENFLRLRNAARALGGSLAELTALQKQATVALAAQRVAQIAAIHAEARGLAGVPQTAAQRFADLMAHFTRLREAARALGTSLATLTAIQGQATAAFQAQIKAEAAAIHVEARGLVGIPPSATERFTELMAHFTRLRNEARALGISLSTLTSLQKQATAAFKAQIAAEKAALLVQAQQLTGLAPTEAQEFAALMLQFTNLRNQARALGMDLGKLTAIQKEAQAHLVREQQLRRNEMALSVVEPFKQLREPLVAFGRDLQLGNMNPADQAAAQRNEFQLIAQRAMSGDLEAIRQLQGAGQEWIRMAEQFGGSAAGADARTEVMRVVKDVLASIDAAQKLAMMGVEGAVKAAELAIVDTLGELVKIGRETVAEIMRLRGVVAPTVPKPTPLPRPTSVALTAPTPLPRPTTSAALQASNDFQRIVAEVQAGNRAKIEELQASVQRAISNPSRAAASATPRPEAVMAAAIGKFEQGQKDSTKELIDEVRRSTQRELEGTKGLSGKLDVVADEIKRLGRKNNASR